MSDQKMSRREREKARYKQEILDVAIQLFSQKGFHEVSMQEIAEQSELSVGTLYNFFESKELLFDEIIETVGNQILSEFMVILNGPGSEIERLSAFFKYQPELLQQHEKVVKLFVLVFGIKGTQISKYRDSGKVSEVLNKKIAQLIDQGIHKEVFRTVDPEITAKAISAAMEALTFELAGSNRSDIVEKFEKVKELFLYGLMKPGDYKDA